MLAKKPWVKRPRSGVCESMRALLCLILLEHIGSALVLWRSSCLVVSSLGMDGHFEGLAVHH